jgi:hypothetical protein
MYLRSIFDSAAYVKVPRYRGVNSYTVPAGVSGVKVAEDT